MQVLVRCMLRLWCCNRPAKDSTCLWKGGRRKSCRAITLGLHDEGRKLNIAATQGILPLGNKVQPGVIPVPAALCSLLCCQVKVDDQQPWHSCCAPWCRRMLALYLLSAELLSSLRALVGVERTCTPLRLC